MDETLGGAMDFLLVNEAGRETKKFLPPVMPQPIRLGRETDNDIVLTDARVSRHHAQFRRAARGIEVMDVGSANGTAIGGNTIAPNVWHAVPAGAVIYVGDTTVVYHPRLDQAPTLSVVPVAPKGEGVQPGGPRESGGRLRPWVIIGAALGVVAVAVVLAVLFWPQPGTPGPTPTQPPPIQSQVAQQPGDATLVEPSEGTMESGTPFPVIAVSSVVVEPIILGALPDTTQAFVIVKVRVENQGSGDFSLSSNQFRLVDSTGLELKEIGGTYSEEGLRKLGLADRYENLRLKPGDSVGESLLFSVNAQLYQFHLRYGAPGLQPINMNLGPVDVGRELAIALGTPTPEGATAVAMAPVTTETVTATLTRPAAVSVPKTVPSSSLKGTIAYPVFNGETYDLYLGSADGSGSRFFLAGASQPQFSPDGQRIAYHSWQTNKRGLVTVDLSGGNEHIVAGNLEDQLPTWSPDGTEVMFLSRRSGQRASELYVVPSLGGDVGMVGNGEYPTWGGGGDLVFKGWESTGVGLRLADANMADMVELTSDDTDTAPALSPDGKRIAFMSKREDNWDIYIVDRDGENLRRLTDDPAQDGLPTWSPDGKVIAFVSNRGGPWSVWATTPSDGNGGNRQLFPMEGSPDGFVAGEDLDKSRGWAEERISWTD